MKEAMAHQDDGDDELDLPPLDADEGDDLADPTAGHGDDMLPQGEEPDGLDDTTAADLDVGDDLDDLDDPDDGQRGEAESDVDVGALDEGIDFDGDDEAPAGSAEDEGSAADAEGVAVDESDGDDDAGAEGTSESPEDQVDEADLPEIDDGDDAEGSEALADVLLAEAEETLPPWGRARLALLDGAGAAVPCSRVAVAAGRVAAAGEVLLFVEEGARAARRLPFGEGIVAVALADDALLVATSRGQLLAGRDGGAEAVSLGSWRSAAGTAVGASAGATVELAATPGRFWIRAGGALYCAAHAPLQAALAPLTELRDRGVLAIAASGGTLVAVTLGRSGPAIERFRGDDEGGMDAPLSGLAREIVEHGAGTLLLAAAAGGRCLAVGDGERVAVSRDGGATFTSIDSGPAAALAFAGDEAQAPLLALVRSPAAPGAAAPVFIVQANASGDAVRIGELAGADPPAAIAWDGAREVVWVASGAGLQALGMPRQH